MLYQSVCSLRLHDTPVGALARLSEIARIELRDSVPLDVAGSGAHCLLFCFEGVLLFHAAC